MSELAKSSRKAMQAKAKRLSATTTQKVDSSTWSPPAELDADVKTGARPLVRRIYKSGGKVVGEMAKKRADRAARKSGGRTAPWVDDLINRDVRTANEAREGKKHVGAFKKGGRTGKLSGGTLRSYIEEASADRDRSYGNLGSMGHDLQGKMYDAKELWKMQKRQRGIDSAEKKLERMGKKSGGRSKHADGGKPKYDPYKDVGSPLSPEQEAMIKKGKDPYQDRFAPTRTTPERAPSKSRVPMPVPRPSNMKKGGEAGHPDVALDKALIKKMIKPSAMKDAKCYGGKAKKEEGGSVFSGNSTTKIPGVVGGRKAHKRGGKTKGKTNININIMPQAGGAPMPPMGIKPPVLPALPPVAPPAGAPPMGGAGSDPALLAALAGGMKGGAPAPMPAPMPMARKSGGRTIHVINHASGGGLGRLEKIKAYGEAQKKLS